MSGNGDLRPDEAGEGLAPVPARPGGQKVGFAPSSIDDLRWVSTQMHASGLVPNSFDTVQKVAVAIMAGAELGFAPFQSVQALAVINGRPSLWGDAIPALLWSNGFDLEEWIEGEGDKMTAYCRITRPNGKQVERSFSVEDAKRARLWDEKQKVTRRGAGGSTYEKDNDSPWHRYPKRMLQKRALGFAARDGAPDVLKGIAVAEEQRDIPMRDVTPQDAPKRPGMMERMTAAKQMPEPEGEAPEPREKSEPEAPVSDDPADGADAEDPGDFDAYTEGADDRKNGAAKDECPYEADSADGAQWLKGWKSQDLFERQEADEKPAPRGEKGEG